jgi:hypothetical protein
MKVIDHTPFREKDGTISIVGRTQAALKYGPSWSSMLDGQDIVIAIMEKHLGSKFTLLRNVVLPGTDDVRLPLVLTGPPGIYLLNVSHLRGVYRAKGEEWGTISGNAFKPSTPNLLTRTVRYGQGLQKFLDKQGFSGRVSVEPILLTTNPGLHADSVRPIVRVVMSDALERFAISVSQAGQALSPEIAEAVTERILKPKTVKTAQSAPVQVAAPRQTPIYDPYAKEEPEKNEAGQRAAPAAKPAVKPSTNQSKAPSSKGKTPTGKKTAQSGVNLTNKQFALIAGAFGLLILCLVALIIAAFIMNVA